MSKVFFGKMNNPEQVSNKIYETEDKKFLADIEPGDYAFIKLAKEDSPASVKRLWRLKEVKQEGHVWHAIFDEIFKFDPIPLLKFEALDLFILDMNLLNKCNKATQGLSFFQISMTDKSLFEELIKSKDEFNKYINAADHRRKIVKVNSKEQVDANSIDVQLYKEDESWILGESPFIGEDLKENFDSNQFNKFDESGNKEKKTAKCQMYRFLSGSSVSTDEVPMMGLWDLFLGTVKDIESIIRIEQNKRKDFIDYCKKHGVGSASNQYENGLRKIENEMSVNIDEQYNSDKCNSLLKNIEVYKDQFTSDTLGGRKNWVHYTKKYIEYKESLNKSPKVIYESPQAKYYGINKIFYGTPGCGKSYYVQKLVEQEIDPELVIRTTFFQDYSNTDFVGQILPMVTGNTVTYEFNPGPFTLALKYAIVNPKDKVALIIEELNRGNAPSIFGDIFQLLDRDKGESRYPIVNINIQSYLKKELRIDLINIKIPSNLYIYATMNTSDQNVFTLDTAFKRRWQFEKLENEFKKEDTIKEKLVPGFNNVKWKTFVSTINKFIISHATSLSAEDKQIGKYFVDENLLWDSMGDYSNEDDRIREFAHKIFEYLWTDVAKFNRTEWFVGEIKSLDDLIYKFVNHEQVFTSALAANLPIYEPAEEEE